MQLIAELYVLLKANIPYLLTKENSHPTAFSLLRWILTVGAIAAHGTSYRAPFAFLLRRLLQGVQGLDTFEDFKITELEAVIWHESSCDDAGKRLWEEIRSYTAQT